MRARHYWQVWLSLDGFERGLLAQLAFFIPLTALALRFWGMTRVRRFATGADDSDPNVLTGTEPEMARRIRAVTGIVERHAPLRGNCLSRSLALVWLLRRRGIASAMHIGVRETAGRLQAHAWVESNGNRLNDSANMWRGFIPFQQPVIVSGTDWT